MYICFLHAGKVYVILALKLHDALCFATFFYCGKCSLSHNNYCLLTFVASSEISSVV
jgi:hypothetical protein